MRWIEKLVLMFASSFKKNKFTRYYEQTGEKGL